MVRSFQQNLRRKATRSAFPPPNRPIIGVQTPRQSMSTSREMYWDGVLRAREGLIKCSMASWTLLGDRASAAKAAYLAGSSGTAEAVPYPKSFGDELNQRFPKAREGPRRWRAYE